MSTKYAKLIAVFLFIIIGVNMSEAQFSKSEATIELRSGKLMLSPSTTSIYESIRLTWTLDTIRSM